jgi:hypothetical protein
MSDEADNNDAAADVNSVMQMMDDNAYSNTAM